LQLAGKRRWIFLCELVPRFLEALSGQCVGFSASIDVYVQVSEPTIRSKPIAKGRLADARGTEQKVVHAGPIRLPRAQSSRQAEFGGRGMSFNICRGTLGSLEMLAA